MEQEEFRTALIAAINSMTEELRTLNDHMERQSKFTLLAMTYDYVSDLGSIDEAAQLVLRYVDELTLS